MGHTFGVRVQRTHLRCEGSEGSKGSKGSEGGGGGFAASFIKKGRGWRRGLCRRVMFAPLKGRRPFGPRVVVLPYRAMSIKPALRDWLSVSYVTQYPVPLIFSFPLEGKSREAGKGVRGKAPIGCSITVLTTNRILLIGSLRWTSPTVRSVNRKEGPFMGRLRAYFARLAHPMQDVHSGQ